MPPSGFTLSRRVGAERWLEGYPWAAWFPGLKNRDPGHHIWVSSAEVGGVVPALENELVDLFAGAGDGFEIALVFDLKG